MSDLQPGQRVTISTGCPIADFIGMAGEIASVEAWGYEIRLDGDGFETPFYRQEVEAEQEAA